MTFIRLLLVLPAAIIGFVLGNLFINFERLAFVLKYGDIVSNLGYEAPVDRPYLSACISTISFLLAGIYTAPDKYKRYSFYVLSVILTILYSISIYIIITNTESVSEIFKAIIELGCLIVGGVIAFNLCKDEFF